MATLNKYFTIFVFIVEVMCNKICFLCRQMANLERDLVNKNAHWFLLLNNIWGLSKKTTCLRGRVAEWPSGRVAEINFGLMPTNVYDSGRSRKVKNPHLLQ